MKKCWGLLLGAGILSLPAAQAQAPLPSNVAFQLTQASRIVERAERSLGGAGGPTAGHVMFTDPMLEENVK